MFVVVGVVDVRIFDVEVVVVGVVVVEVVAVRIDVGVDDVGVVVVISIERRSIILKDITAMKGRLWWWLGIQA